MIVELDPQTSEQARRLAEAQGTTVDALVQSLIVQLERDTMAQDDALMGMFADEPALLDEIVEQAMEDRQDHTLRLNRA